MKIPHVRLDTVATLAIICVCVVLIWVLFSEPAPLRATAPDRSARTRPPARSAPLPTRPVSLDGLTFMGNLTAPLAVMVFSEFQCPFCARFAREVMPEIQKHFVGTGKVRFVFRHLPLERIHPFAFRAAESAECAGEQGRFWPMHDLLFADQGSLDEPSLLRRARTLGLDVRRFETCLAGSAAARVGRDMAEAAEFKISSTPAFLIGVVQVDGTLVVKQRLNGAQSATQFRSVLDKLGAEAAAATK